MAALTQDKAPKSVAIGARLRHSDQVITLGFKPNYLDYTPHERRLIERAPKIYYPTLFYADLFKTMEKPTFPSFQTYVFALNKIRQTTLFNLMNIPHPRTRFFYGHRQKQTILDYFSFPFIAKKGTGSARGDHVYRIQSQTELIQYIDEINAQPAYIQEYLPIHKDIRVVVIGKKIRLAYWRKADVNQFKTNLSQGGEICFNDVPPKALDLALSTALVCRWDDVGIDIIEHENRFYVLEINVKYGTKGFEKAGINYKHLLNDLIRDKEI